MPSRPNLHVRDGVDGERDNKQARGVNGLEVGHHYGLRPGKGWGYIRWWQDGEKDAVINPAEGKLDGRELAYRNKAPYPGIRVDVEKLPEIEFWCIQ